MIMTEQQNRQRILQMMKDGLIELDEAAELLAALDKNSVAEQPAPVSKEKSKYKYLKVVVDAEGNADTGEGKAKVRVNIPLSFAKSGLQIAQRFIPEEARKSMEANNIALEDIIEILAHLDDFEDSDIVNVDANDNESGQCHVRVFLE